MCVCVQQYFPFDVGHVFDTMLHDVMLTNFSCTWPRYFMKTVTICLTVAHLRLARSRHHFRIHSGCTYCTCTNIAEITSHGDHCKELTDPWQSQGATSLSKLSVSRQIRQSADGFSESRPLWVSFADDISTIVGVTSTVAGVTSTIVGVTPTIGGVTGVISTIVGISNTIASSCFVIVGSVSLLHDDSSNSHHHHDFPSSKLTLLILISFQSFRDAA